MNLFSIGTPAVDVTENTNSTVVLGVNGPVSINCVTMLGTFQPDIEWLHSDGASSFIDIPLERVTISEEAYPVSSTLSFGSFNIENAGEYVCISNYTHDGIQFHNEASLNISVESKLSQKVSCAFIHSFLFYIVPTPSVTVSLLNPLDPSLLIEGTYIELLCVSEINVSSVAVSFDWFCNDEKLTWNSSGFTIFPASYIYSSKVEVEVLKRKNGNMFFCTCKVTIAATVNKAFVFPKENASTISLTVQGNGHSK